MKQLASLLTDLCPPMIRPITYWALLILPMLLLFDWNAKPMQTKVILPGYFKVLLYNRITDNKGTCSSFMTG